jgi:hypothetical protein
LSSNELVAAFATKLRAALVGEATLRALWLAAASRPRRASYNEIKIRVNNNQREWRSEQPPAICLYSSPLSIFGPSTVETLYLTKNKT